MNALTNAILSYLHRHPLVESVRVINYESKLSGRVLEDLPKVLAEAGQWIEKEH